MGVTDLLTRRNTIKFLASTLIAAPAVLRTGSSIAQAKPGEGKEIKLARASLDTFWFGTYILQKAFQELGYKVAEPTTYTVPTLFQVIEQGDADLTCDVIVPLAIVPKSLKLIGPFMNPGSINGYLIDRKTAEEHNIKYISDLKKPEIAKIFGEGGNKARMVGPNPGWGSEKFVINQLKETGLDQTIELVQGEYNILSADAISRFKAGQPILAYGWYPNELTVTLRPGKDLVWLAFEDGQADPAYALPNLAGCSADGEMCNTGNPSTQYYVASNPKWAEENPAAVRFLETWKMDLEDRVKQNDLMRAGEKRDSDLKRHAEKWISDNRAEFDKWIAASLG